MTEPEQRSSDVVLASPPCGVKQLSDVFVFLCLFWPAADFTVRVAETHICVLSLAVQEDHMLVSDQCRNIQG